MPEGSREYRDRLFTFIFGSEEHRDWTLSLYNVVNGTDYADSDAVEFTTIREVLYLGMHNDVSFLLADEVSLYEHQSTYCPNMPLRMLQYAASLYERHVRERGGNKYGRRLLRLPVPRLVVFYNGADKPDADELLLSDSFPPVADPDIEVRVRLVDIGPGRGGDLKSGCRPLGEYSWLVERIRDGLLQGKGRMEAIDQAIEEMPRDFEIRPYLQAHKAEVRDMLLTEYNEAEAMELFRQEGREEGREEGRQEGLEEGRQEGRREGRQEGLEEGRQEGRQEGLEEGRQEGLEEGREEGRQETTVGHLASLMRALGVTAAQAMEILGVPAAERGRYLSML